MKKVSLVLLMLVTAIAGAQSSGPVNTPQLNKAYFFVGTSPYTTTIQSAVTAACAATSHSGEAVVPPGITPTDAPTAATGCTGVSIVEQNVLPWVCYAWGASGPYAVTACSGSSTSGTVTVVTAGNLSPLFTTVVNNGSTTPNIVFSLSNAAAHSVLAGPASGSAGAPSYQTAPAISAANMTNFPNFPFTQITGVATPAQLPAATTTTQGAVILPTGASGNTLGTAAITAAVGGGGSVPTTTATTSTVDDVATFNNTTGEVKDSTIKMPASIIPASGANFMQIQATGAVSSIQGITAACGGPTCGIQQINFPSCSTTTTLSANITNSQTSFTVTSASCLSAPLILVVANNSPIEMIACTTLTGTTLSGCTRGYWGTTALTLSAAGSFVAQVSYGLSLASSSYPYYFVLQNGANNYLPPTNGGCVTTSCLQYGSAATFSGGFNSGAASTMSLSSSTIYAAPVTFQNPGAGSSCGTDGHIIVMSNADPKWYIGEANANCTFATNGITPDVMGIKSAPTGGSAFSGDWGITVTPTTYNFKTIGALGSGAPQTTVNCSTSGTAIFSEPMQGASEKDVMVNFQSCTGTASYTFPLAYTFSPSPVGLAALTSLVTTTSTTAVTVTGSASTGFIKLIGY